MGKKADLVLFNANIVTFDPAKPRAGLVAVKDGKIIRVGRSEEKDAFEGRKINCNGKTLVPGFNDAHCHILALASSLQAVDCSPPSVSSIADIKARIRERAQATSEGEWVRAVGYDEFRLDERRYPTRYDLDEAAPSNPVKLMHRSRHACVLNSMALSMIGIKNDTPEPPGGMIDRSLDTGEPNGILYEMSDYIDSKIPPLPPEELDNGVTLANDEYLSRGITSLQDATASNDLGSWNVLRRMREKGHLVPRVSMMLGLRHLDELMERDFSPRHGDHDMRLGALKVMLSEVRGVLHPSSEELEECLAKAHRHGYQVAIHAVEESTVAAAVAALERVLGHASKNNHRHRIEHCSVCPDSLLDRLEDIRVLIVTQPLFIYHSGERYLATVTEEQQPLLYRISSFLKSGLKPSAGSDNPVAPLDPLLSMHAAVNRRTEDGNVFFPRERVLPAMALEMHTRAPAYATFDEGVKGSISAGKLADFTLLSDDPMKVSPEQIKDIKVEATIVGGKVVWRS
ncbi:MAG: amidohydrolase [Chloroflexota bacterium]|nr:amidohydrolase [Chloroflexota bacterium]